MNDDRTDREKQAQTAGEGYEAAGSAPGDSAANLERAATTSTTWRDRGGSGEDDARVVYYPITPGYEEEETELFFPHEMLKFAIIILLIVGIVTLFSTMVPIQVGNEADPLRTPAHIEPEWYFLAVYQLLKYVPRWLGVGFSFIVFPVLLIFVPFLWNPINRVKYGRTILNVVVALGVLAAIILSVMGLLGFE